MTKLESILYNGVGGGIAAGLISVSIMDWQSNWKYTVPLFVLLLIFLIYVARIHIKEEEQEKANQEN